MKKCSACFGNSGLGHGLINSSLGLVRSALGLVARGLVNITA